MNLRWRRWVRDGDEVEGVRFEVLTVPGFSPAFANVVRTKAEAEGGRRWGEVFEEHSPEELKVHPVATVMREILACLDEDDDKVGTEETMQ